MFNKNCLCRIVDNIHEIHNVSITVIETDENGKGVFSFSVENECLRIRLPENAIRWLSDEDCADGVIFEFASDGTKLHLVELKSTMNPGKLAKVKKQYFGAYVNARAMAVALGIENISEVKLHLAYKKDAFRDVSTASPTLAKPLVGDSLTKSLGEWRSKKITINGLPGPLVLNAVLRDESGNASTQL